MAKKTTKPNFANETSSQTSTSNSSSGPRTTRKAPASVVVNERGDILYIHGRTGMYLEPSPGEPRNNVLEMAREGLQIELAAAMRECGRTGAEVTREDIRVKANDQFAHIDVTVAKLDDPESVRGLLLVTFRPAPPTPPPRAKTKRLRKQAGDGERIEQLERELQYMKESHQRTLEEIATVFLDNELNIKRFTEQATELVSLRQTDVGRPISELASSLEHDDLAADCRGVLKTLVFQESPMRTKDGSWYLMRIMPYRTADNVIDGLVLTFVNHNRLREAQTKLHRMSKVFMDGSDPIVIVDLEGKINDLNDEAVHVYGFSREEMLGHRHAHQNGNNIN